MAVKKITDTDKRLKERMSLCRELPMILHRLDACGLNSTARLMNEVVLSIGWECTCKPKGTK